MNRLKRSRLLCEDESVACVSVVPNVPAVRNPPPLPVPPQDSALQEDSSWSHVCKPQSWSDLKAFAPSVSLAMQNGKRCFNGLAQTMAVIEGLVVSKGLLVLQGPPGTGKTTMLQLYAQHKGLVCECIHPDDDDHLKEILKGAKDSGLVPTPTLWVFEHLDCMSKSARRMILQALPLSGPAIATAWPTDENLSDLPVQWFVMDPWDHASRVQFMMKFSTVAVSDDALSMYLHASGGDICGAWNIARVCVSSKGTVLRTPPSNLRTLVDASFTRDVSDAELDMINDCDEDTCLQLVQETLPFACVTSSLKSLVDAYEALSVCDATAGFSGMVKGAYISGVLQKTLTRPSTYSSGLSFSAPKSTWSKFRSKDVVEKNRILRGMPTSDDVEVDSRLDVLGSWGEDDTLVPYIKSSVKTTAKSAVKSTVKSGKPKNKK